METMATSTAFWYFRKRQLENHINHRGVVTAAKISRLRLLCLSILVLLSVPGGLASIPCCSICDCRPREVWCERRSLTSLPVDIPVNTRRLYLFNNNISTIPDGSLSKLKSLQLLDLSSNKLTSDSIKPGVLSALVSLSDLNLSENKLTKLKTNTFSGIESLVRLYLEENRIDNIETNALKNLSNLVELKLSKNLLRTFPKIVACPKLQRLYLSHNHLERLQFGSLSGVNLEQLTLSSNRLLQLPSTVFRDTRNMRELDISNNRMTRLPKCISKMSSLQMLNLSGNSISSLPANFLGNLRRMKSLDLQGLQLTTLPKGFIPRRVYLNIFDISNNPWNCDCAISWLPEYMRAVGGAISRSDEVECRTPATLQRRQIATLYEQNFACHSNPAKPNANPEPSSPPKRKPTVDLCDGISCANGATCFINSTSNRPACRCLSGWTSFLCNEPVHEPVRSTTTGPTSTRSPNRSGKRQLLIRQETSSSDSVDIIFPTSEKQMTITVAEALTEDTNRLTFTTTVRPGTNMYKVRNLKQGKKYIICISLFDVMHTSEKQSRKVEDKLCGEVEITATKTTTNIPARLFTSATKNDGIGKVIGGKDPRQNDDNTQDGVKTQPNGNVAADNSAEESSSPKTYEVLAIAAGLGAVLILILIVGAAYFCRKTKKSKKANNNHIERSSKHDNGTIGGTEMVPMMAQHLHYTPQPTTQLLAQNGDVYQTSQQNYQSNGQYPQRIGTPNKTNSLKRSNSSGSMNGTQPYLDIQRCSSPNSSQKFSPPATIPYPSEKGTILNSRGQELIYRTHGNPNIPSETCSETGFRQCDTPTAIVPVRSTCTTVNQYYQEPISTTTISPQTIYQPMDTSIPITVNGYSPGPNVTMPQHTHVHYQPNTQLRYQDTRTPHLNADPYQPVTLPHRMDNGAGHMMHDTIVM